MQLYQIFPSSQIVRIPSYSRRLRSFSVTIYPSGRSNKKMLIFVRKEFLFFFYCNHEMRMNVIGHKDLPM